ncbi:MAG: chemotaxis protein CheA, partial [Pseudanabaenaceae cyanobacterium]
MSASSKAAEVWEEGAEENTETIEELLHDLVTEAESSPVTPEEAEIDDLLAEIEGQQAESVPSVDELLADIEQQAEAIDYPEDEDMTILQGTPEFFATVTAEPKLPEELVEEVSLDDMQGEDTEEEVVEEDMTTIQEMPEFFATLTAEEQEEEGFSIRAYDQQTDVVEFSELFDLEQASQEKEEVRDSDSGNDIEEELSQLLGEIEEQEIEEIASTFASDDEDESGFFFSQETIIDEEDSEGELTLLQLFNADNGEAPESEDPIDELAQLLGEEDRTTETAVAAEEVDAIDELSELLEETGTMAENNTTDVFAELESLLEEEVDISQLEELEALLEQPSPPPSNFDDLDALLSSIPPSPSKAAEVTSPGKGKTALNIAPAPGPSPRSTMVQNMRVDVRYLDNMNNLVGELIVNRNLLQQDQQRLQASLANLFNQINKLNDIAQKVRDEFDRSLMERRLEETLGHRYLKEERRSLIPSTDNKQQEQDHSTLIANDLDKHDKFNELALDIIELITRVKESASDVEFVIDETEQVSRQLGTITTQLEDDLKQVRMEPFSEISDRLPKQVRDLALKRKKQADIEISGRETMIDKVILQGLNTPINHLITNALVHGIEDPETRIALGKPPKGKITVKAYHQGNETIISVSDDGAGINPEKVRQSAITKGILTRAEAALLSDQDTYSLLFRPGFSTKAEVDEEGGRGVGLDAVVTQLNSIKGSIQVESAIGKGTTFTIRLPLTLSISKAIVCVCNRNRVAFPIDSFEDMVEITQDKVYKNAEGLPCFTWRDRE